jgi:hypothetical protein
MDISVISLISYDAHYLPSSISRYYKYVDEIVLGLDESRISWSGNSFTFDESSLWSALKAIDVDNKISVVEDNFHKSAIAIENDNYERNFLKNYCTNKLILSIDADEEILNAAEFFNNYLPIASRYTKKVDFCMTWLTPYKIIDDTVLVIVNEDDSFFHGEKQAVLSNKEATYTYARWTDISATGKNRVLSPLAALHWSLCRTEEELYQKINNIGHSNIAATDPFFNTWKAVTLDNYKQLRNFKTAGTGNIQWPKLLAIPKGELESYYLQNIERKN